MTWWWGSDEALPHAPGFLGSRFRSGGMSELINIDGIGTDEAELLVATGWTDVHALARADVDVLMREISAANEMLRIVPRTPERRKVERWVASAGRLLDPAAAGSPAKRAARSVRPATPVTSAPQPVPDKSKGPSRAKVGKNPVLPVKSTMPTAAPPEAGLASPAASGPVEDAGEAALRALSGPVNFEAEPDVVEMLAVAPFAVPIPARMLAEKGIAPSEIAVAPVLNRAFGDMEVRVVIEKPQRKDLPVGAGGNRRATAISSVQIADVGFSNGRRGIDTAKVRTTEEAQGDAPPVRVAPVKPGPEELRIALLRAPLPETNAGRKPGSPFYIRGVLHDRPYMAWFGGVFLVLLQLCLPLSVIAAPLLILSDQMPEDFAWVPHWIIVFPISLLLLGILYALIGTRAKCRVCAQRMYVPKQCLKNKKAHHLPLFGYVGAVAMHVILFRWFNCTFCGTSIRIKK
ncbi:MAG: hypothetical protein B9S38_11190 [Verrucomicrobiia bacterium Tous-C4TDCM]|nr:MAG: hypothetical protein B9S38_11190 [Verrucomicrobiae bacterium Tous-C4TDCM]